VALPDAPRFLVMRPDHIGDVLFATPALRLLRKAWPDAYLACAAGPWAGDVLRDNPHLDELIVCEFPGFARRPKGSLLEPYRVLWQWAQRLKLGRFDAAIVLRFDHWWGALAAYLAGIPHRVGYAVPECAPFLTTAVPYAGVQHEVLRNLALVERFLQAHGKGVPQDGLALEFVSSTQDDEYASRYLEERGIPASQPVVAIHPGAGAPVKQWRPEAFAVVADAMVRQWGAAIVLTGSKADLHLAWSVYAAMRTDAVVAAGDTTVGQLAALFRRSCLVIGPDSGPLHLAVAVGTPTVHLYGPADPLKFGPWGDGARHRVVKSDRECVPCGRLDYAAAELPAHPCVQEITLEAVSRAVAGLLTVNSAGLRPDGGYEAS
jgi:heptosyltransferase-2/heptosyltransferase-3